MKKIFKANKLELSSTSFKFEDIIKRVVNIVQFRVDELNQKLYINIDENIPIWLIGDDQRLSQVITNLLSNAVKFTPEDGIIKLNAKLNFEKEDKYCLQISVEDTGIGVTEEQKERLFNSFEQAEKGTSKKFGGTGLGLAISKRIVEMMGGEIWVDSIHGQGTTITFTAVFEKDLIEHKKDMEKENAIEKKKDDFLGKIVLLAEDVEINREIISVLLEDIKLGVDFAENGKQAVEMFEKYPEKYSLIFMDIQMPEMDGYESTRNIRNLSISRAKEIPIG